ncbi:MAG: FAD-dependent oxidoreductase [Panacagrimonas sp.]
MAEQTEFDVVVAGSGSAGMTAAIVAAHAGLKVLLVEKSRYFGGTTAWSGGGCWVPANKLMQQIGLSDSREAAETYANAVVGPYLRKDLYGAFLDNAQKMLDFMFAKTEVRFMPRSPAPDYRMDAPGSLVGGRSLGSVPYDGRLLGPHLDRLNPPLTSFNAPWGMMMSPLDLMHAMAVFKSWPSFKHMAKLFMRYAVDLLRFGRGTRLTMGNALAARLLKSAVDAGVMLWPETSAVRLLKTGERVTGLVVIRDGQEHSIHARKGVVLATGGFAGSAEMRAQLYPHAENHLSMVVDGNTGDGQSMAQSVGAVMEPQAARNGFWCVVSKLDKPDGSLVKVPHFYTDIPKPGCIAVNAAGKRFGNEAALELGAAMHATGSVPAWLICDHRFIKRYGIGLVYPFGIRLGKMRRAGYFTRANTLSELAAKIGVDATGLEQTAARHNEFARSGVDTDCGKGASAFDRAMGDAGHQPNPCLGPIANAPFYSVKIYPGDVCSSLGLRVNMLGQPLTAQDQPIAGLHVCGLDMNSLWSGLGFANGAFHSQNMTFGYIIGRTLAGETP